MPFFDQISAQKIPKSVLNTQEESFKKNFYLVKFKKFNLYVVKLY